MSRKKVEMCADRYDRPEYTSYVLFAGGLQTLVYVGVVKIFATPAAYEGTVGRGK